MYLDGSVGPELSEKLERQMDKEREQDRSWDCYTYVSAWECVGDSECQPWEHVGERIIDWHVNPDRVQEPWKELCRGVAKGYLLHPEYCRQLKARSPLLSGAARL